MNEFNVWKNGEIVRTILALSFQDAFKKLNNAGVQLTLKPDFN